MRVFKYLGILVVVQTRTGNRSRVAAVPGRACVPAAAAAAPQARREATSLPGRRTRMLARTPVTVAMLGPLLCMFLEK